MRPIALLSTLFVLSLTIATSAQPDGRRDHDGQQIFRYDTFGDEQLWTNVLRMH